MRRPETSFDGFLLIKLLTARLNFVVITTIEYDVKSVSSELNKLLPKSRWGGGGGFGRVVPGEKVERH